MDISMCIDPDDTEFFFGICHPQTGDGTSGIAVIAGNEDGEVSGFQGVHHGLGNALVHLHDVVDLDRIGGFDVVQYLIVVAGYDGGRMVLEIAAAFGPGCHPDSIKTQAGTSGSRTQFTVDGDDSYCTHKGSKLLLLSRMLHHG